MIEYNRVPLFSLVGQESDLFGSLSLLDNIKYGSITLPGIELMDEIKKNNAMTQAAIDADLIPIIEKIKNGWDANVGPKGRLLSGGERQR